MFWLWALPSLEQRDGRWLPIVSKKKMARVTVVLFVFINLYICVISLIGKSDIFVINYSFMYYQYFKGSFGDLVPLNIRCYGALIGWNAASISPLQAQCWHVYRLITYNTYARIAQLRKITVPFWGHLLKVHVPFWFQCSQNLFSYFFFVFK